MEPLARRLQCVRGLHPARAETVAGLAAAAQELALERGSPLCLQGDPWLGVHAVLEGELKVGRVGQSGREQIAYFARPERLILEGLGLGPGARSPVNVVALQPTVAVLLPAATLFEAIAADPALARGLLEEQGHRIARYVALADDLGIKSVRARLAAFLWSLALKDGAAPGRAHRLSRTLTMETVAARLGTVREELSRTLAALEREGLVSLDRETITVRNLDGLRDASEG